MTEMLGFKLIMMLAHWKCQLFGSKATQRYDLLLGIVQKYVTV